jgi:hypothetical protein
MGQVYIFVSLINICGIAVFSVRNGMGDTILSTYLVSMGSCTLYLSFV